MIPMSALPIGKRNAGPPPRITEAMRRAYRERAAAREAEKRRKLAAAAERFRRNYEAHSRG